MMRAILLDIEGTSTPIAFVHETLFSYARTHAREFLLQNDGVAEVRADIARLREEHALDMSNSEQPPALDESALVDSLVEYVEWLIARDRKSTGLKSLQGKIWRQGYTDGSLKSQVYPDVAPAFARWQAKGWSLSIFSSGSVLAQQLLFAHTEAGDLTKFIDRYFDTNVGKKGEAESYRKIAEALSLRADEILFVSDVVAELDAANDAGMETLLSIRPGNQPAERAERYRAIHSFEEI
jgi:enolase-phosphatase E1